MLSQPLVINNIKDLNLNLQPKTKILTHQGIELRMKHAMVRGDQPTNWCPKVLKLSKTVHVLDVLQCPNVTNCEMPATRHCTVVSCTLELIIDLFRLCSCWYDFQNHPYLIIWKEKTHKNAKSDHCPGWGWFAHGQPEVEGHRVRAGRAEEVHCKDHKTLSGCYQG